FFFSIFQGLSYVGGLPAGTLTDRKLRPAVAACLGAALLTLGYASLATQQRFLLGPALALLIIGQGFFKPNMAVLIGSHFSAGGARRDRAFLWQYVAANLGALAGPLFVEMFCPRGSWDTAFLTLVCVSCIGTIILALGSRIIEPARPFRHSEPAAI